MFFDILFEAINAPTPLQKHQLIHIFVAESKPFLSSPHTQLPKANIYPLTQPSYAGFCTITHPTKIRRPKYIRSAESLAKILHSIVHIEYSAIDLALDAMYRFRDLPLSYYKDWLEVALEEETHFSLLHKCLNDLGYEYGDFPVHTQLFDAQKATSCLSDRMALLHRGLEANGLDSNPFVVHKVQEFEHTTTPQLLETLAIILRDEISHVKKGDKWWKYSCSSPTTQNFLATLQHFHTFYHIPKTLNIQARLQAGFSLDEIDTMQMYSQK